MNNGMTGGHWKPCNIGSVEAHNERRPEYLEAIKKAGLNLYFFQELTENNSHWVSGSVRYSGKTVADIFESMKNLYKEKTGQMPQLKEKIKLNKKTGKEYKCAGWSPIREMCVPIKENTKIEDFNYLKKWAEKYGIEIMRIDLHKDEGHRDKSGQYKLNNHAHVVASFFNWQNAKTVKPNKEAMSEMQTVLAIALGMKRGERKTDTGRKYLDHVEYRKMMEEIDKEKEKLDFLLEQQSEETKKLEILTARVKQAETRVKGLTTMLNNLEDQKDNLEAQIAALEDEYADNNEQLEQKRSELLAKLAEIEEKIADKTQKREKAEKELANLEEKAKNLVENNEKERKSLNILKDKANQLCDSVNSSLKNRREEIKKMDKAGELRMAERHIEERDAMIFRRWPGAREAVSAIFCLGNSPTAKDFTPQQALDVERAIETSGIDREDAAKDLLSLAGKDFDRSRTPRGWVDGAAREVMSIARGAHQRLNSLLRGQSQDAGGGPSYITDLTDWAGNQISR